VRQEKEHPVAINTRHVRCEAGERTPGSYSIRGTYAVRQDKEHPVAINTRHVRCEAGERTPGSY